MNNLPEYFWPGIAILALILAGYLYSLKHQVLPKLSFLINKNKNQMQPISSLTLTSLTPLSVPFAVVDANNANTPIPGAYSGLSISVSDPAQGTAAIPDPSQQNASIDALTEAGTFTVTLTGTFASTKLKADGTPLVSGTFTATLTVTNNVVVNSVFTFLGQ